MNKLKQIEKLQQIKELRRKLAELEVAKARSGLHGAQDALQRAFQNEELVKAQSDEKRQSRLDKLLNSSENIRIDSSRIVNVYHQTDQEIDQSRQLTVSRRSQVLQAEEILKTRQEKLARFLQVEERTRKLCERLEAQVAAEELRKD